MERPAGPSMLTAFDPLPSGGERGVELRSLETVTVSRNYARADEQKQALTLRLERPSSEERVGAIMDGATLDLVGPS